MKLLLPLVLALIGLGSGIGAGIALRPAPEAVVTAGDEVEPEAEAHDGMTEHAPEPTAPHAPAIEPDLNSEFVEMPNQFVIPLIRGDDVTAMVVLSITLEVAQGSSDAAMAREPKLRDLFLRVLLDHANTGGFDGAFTANASMQNLRGALEESARFQLGNAVSNVLITEINRQDV